MFGRTFRPAVNASRVMASQRRFGHWLHKNARVEENQGLRENSIKDWKFDTQTIPALLGYLFVPGFLFYVVAMEENEIKHAQIGSPMVFGMIPGKKQISKDE